MNEITLSHVQLKDIQVSKTNPRKIFDETALKELASSIEEKGVLQPVIIRPKGKKYEMVAGERRLRACIMADLKTIPAIIRELNDEEVLEIQIIENLQRKDVHPMEEAVGFMHLQTIKNFDIKEIALRVGKSPQYVAGRLKLNALIEPIQKVFYESRLSMKDALAIAAMSPVDQADIFEEQIEDDRDAVIEINRWVFNKYQHRLSNAPFDTTDPELKKDMGACTSCPFNSAYNTLLFPEAENNPVCNNRDCFKQKCTIYFDRELIKAQEDPEVVLITGQYNVDKETRELMKKHEILEYSNYDVTYAPDYPDRADFEGDNDTDEEDEADFKRAVERYYDEKAEFENKIAAGGYVKAFNVGGNDKGKYEYVKLKKTAKGKAAAGKQLDEEFLDTKLEIERLKNREKRNKELDVIKVWDEIKKHFNPHANASVLKGDLSQLEMDALALAMYNKLDYQAKDSFRKLFKIDGRNGKIENVNCVMLNQMIRFFFLDVLPPAVLYNSNANNEDYLMSMKIAKQYFPTVVEDIEVKQTEIANKRALRVEERIKKLKSSMKKPAEKKESEIKEPAAPIIIKDGATKKGKGLKALLKDA